MKRTLSVVLCLMMLMLLSFTAFAEESSDTNWDSISEQRYQYLDSTSRDIWDDMTYEEKLNASHIPEEKLISMTDQQLLWAIDDYPFLVNILLFDSYRDGYENLLENCDALRELVSRENAFWKYLNHYNSLNVPKSVDAVNAYGDIADLIYAEIILANMEDVAAFSVQEKVSVLEVIQEKREEKASVPEIFGGDICTLYENETGIADTVFRASYNGPYTIVSLKGKSISGYKLSSIDYTTAESDSICADIRDSYTNITISGAATRKYNCHSYACYKRSTSNTYWVETAPTGCGYTRRDTAVNGGAIYYASGSPHSGVVHAVSGGTSVLVKSKWGNGPLVQHGTSNCPYGSSVLYYD
ncbi:hypothetical protein LQE92_04495 [Lacrimispora sp. NSJ-141]|uniref:Uncharacterized protein n=1 Tax=Lientehia hominis TaxID=2897778 RepID=A0AAP2RHR1_9FIRM|nr:hypothetical protein [Lientehia hominis]MCD2491885.1 hypothetical protein [Lientehia hominis]